jgi:hypothetical protein
MPDIDTSAINSAIQQIAQDGFATINIGGESITVKSVAELIQARDALAASNAASKPRFGLRITKLVPGGCG